MASFFAPYSGTRPKVVQINGHRLLILSKEQDVFDSDTLNEIGANMVRKIRLDGPEEAVLHQLAATNKSGVVVASSELELSQILKGLEAELPWLQ